ELGDIADGCSFRLNLLTPGAQGSAFRLEGCQGTGLAVSFIHERTAGPALAFYRREGCIGAAALGGFLDRGVNLPKAPVEIGDDMNRTFQLGGEGGIPRLEVGLCGTALPYMGGDKLGVHPGGVDNGQPEDEGYKGASPDPCGRAPPPRQPTRGDELRPLH